MGIRRHHNITAANVAFVQYSATNGFPSDLRQHAVRKALEEITKPPFEELPWGGELPQHISVLVLYGDSTDSGDFREDLTAVLGKGLASRRLSRPAAYAPALGAALQAFATINDMSFGKKSAFGCCLRTWGLGCPSHNQRIDI